MTSPVTLSDATLVVVSGVRYAPPLAATDACPVSQTATAEELGELLRRSAAGDDAAFEALYRAAAPRLLGLLARKTGTRETAEEILQEAFVQIWRNASSFDPALGQPMGWMAAIARNAAIDRLRRARRDVPLIALPGPAAIEAVAEAPADDSLRGSESKSILKCLKALDATTRRAIVLSYCYGYTHDELARALDLPLGTVKSAIRRGLPLLRACLES